MRRFPFLLVLAALLTLATGAAPRPARAQVSAADSAAVLLETAGRFQAEGQSDVARALYRFIAEHFASTPAGARAREFLTAVRDEGTVGSGRVELQVFSTLYGLWLGVAVPAAFGADDPEPYGLGLLAGGPVGFLAGRALARSRQPTEGQARAITLGGTWGTWQGAGWAGVLDLGQGEDCTYDPYYGGDVCFEGDGGAEETFAAMVVGGITGIAVGTALSRRAISPGIATTVNFGALWGTWFGFAGGYLADLEDDALLASTLLGGDAGLLAMALGAPKWNPSRSRARLVSIYGVIGALSGLGLDLLIQPDDDKVAIGIPLAGSIVGLALGVGATRDYDARLDGPSGPGPGAEGALLGLREGAWSVAAPLPYPVRVERPGPRGVQRRTALGVTLLSARF